MESENSINNIINNNLLDIEPTKLKTLDPEFLKYNEDLKIIIYISNNCKHAIYKKEFIKNHLKDLHKDYYNNLTKDNRNNILDTLNNLNIINGDILNKYGVIENYKYYFKDLPVENNGYKYIFCPFINFTIKNIRLHLKQKHNFIYTAKNPGYIANLNCQKLYTFGERGFFIIKKSKNQETLNISSNSSNININRPENQLIRSNINELNQEEFIKDFIENDININKLEESEDNLSNKQYNLFQNAYKFYSFFINKDKNILEFLIDKKSDSELYYIFLYRLIIKIAQKNHNNIINLPKHISQAIKDETSTIEISHLKDFKPIEKRTQDNYFPLFANLLIFLIKIYNLQKKYNFNLEDNITLKHPLLNTELINKIENVLFYKNNYNNYNNIYKSDIEKLQEELKKLEDILESLIIDLFFYLLNIKVNFLTLQENTSFYNPIISFFILINYDFKNDNFINLSTIQQNCSKIIYMSRLFYIAYLNLMEINYINDLKEKNLDINIHEREPILEIEFNKSYYKLLTNQSQNYFKYIDNLRAYLAFINKNTPSENRSLIDLGNGKIQIYNTNYTIQEIKDFFIYINNKLEDILYNQLLFINKNNLNLFNNINDFYDDININNNNYSILDHKDLKSYRSFLINLLINPNTLIHRKLVRRFINNKPQFYNNKIINWLTNRDEFIKLLSLAFYLFSGNPVRGEELLLLRYKNTLKEGCRNIIYNNKLKLFYINLYWDKSLNIRQQNRENIRFIPPNLTNITLIYILIISPFYRYLKNEFNTIINSAYLFEINNNRIKNIQLSNIFKLESAEFFKNKGLTLNPWRHLINYIIKNYIKNTDPFNPNKENINDNIEDILANHTSYTADFNYSISKEIPLNITTNFFKLSQDFCMEYFKFFNLLDPQISSNILHKHQKSSIEIPIRKSIKLNQELENINEEQNLIRSLNIKNKIQSSFINENNLIIYLQDFFNNKYANFTSENQKLAILNILNKESFIIYISATGSGKSLLFLLPSFIESSNIYIIITPRYELKMNLFNKAKEKNIKTEIFEDIKGDNIITNLLFISLENIISNKFRDLIEFYKKNNYSLHFILDEIHLFILERDFRPLLTFISSIIKEKIPILFLSATLPNELSYLIQNKFNLSNNVKIIKNDINRSNIKYILKESNNTKLNINLIKKTIKKEILPNIINTNYKGLIFIFTIKRGKHLNKYFNIPFYYSNNPNKTDIFNHFINNTSNKVEDKFLISTSALTTGIDFNFIQYIIFAFEFEGFINIIQGIDRIREEGTVYILYNPPNKYQKEETFKNLKLSINNYEDFKKFDKAKTIELIEEKKCVRYLINQYLNNINQEFCDLNKDILCNLCENRNNHLNIAKIKE